MPRYFVVLISGLSISLSAAGVVAQQKDEKGAPDGTPGKEHRQLDPLVGKWDVVVRYTLGGKEREGTAESEAKWVLDGRYLQQEYKSDFSGRPFTVLQFLGYDQHKKRFFEIKMDSMDTGIMHNEGTISNDGKVLTCSGDRIDPTTGKTVKLRTVTTLADSDHYTLEWYFTDSEGKEEKTVTLSHSRKKP
jgi:uncharacterized protein DUF1579